MISAIFMVWWFGLRKAIEYLYKFGKTIDFLIELSEQLSEGPKPVWERIQEIEKSIREIEAKRWALVDLGKMVVFETDSNYEFVWVSKQWAELTGMRSDHSLRRGWLSCVHDGDIGRVGDEWDSCTKDRRRFKCIFRIQAASSIKHVEAIASPAYDSEGVFCGYVGKIEITKAN
ncbi:MAG: PAS domain-containing protein [Candidatus Competibacteraceae bacterium]|nr:PAS domain-containing protein [Candidatus Competibacteraceae bacterium]